MAPGAAQDATLTASLGELQPRLGFEIQVAEPKAHPGVELVAASLDQEAAADTALLRYSMRSATGQRITITHRQARAVAGRSPRGDAIEWRGQRYFVSKRRNAVVVRFVDGDLIHAIHVPNTEPRSVQSAVAIAASLRR